MLGWLATKILTVKVNCLASLEHPFLSLHLILLVISLSEPMSSCFTNWRPVIFFSEEHLNISFSLNIYTIDYCHGNNVSVLVQIIFCRYHPKFCQKIDVLR